MIWYDLTGNIGEEFIWRICDLKSQPPAFSLPDSYANALFLY